MVVKFFDEIDAGAPRRGSDEGGSSNVTERVISQILDGLEDLKAGSYQTLPASRAYVNT
jgi:SpoVK/Ycf46/Vps4 family AAA+-type ATPase